MQGVFVFIIVVTMLIIIIIVTNRKSYYTEEVVSSPTEADFKSKYDVPSIWSSGTDVTGCNLYTFKSSKFSVSSPSLSSSTTCQSSGTCTTSFDQGCRDDDQIYSKTVSHVCRFGELLVASLEDYKGCILSGGTVVKINGYYEEYNTPCSSSLSATDSTDNRCPGTLALVSMPNTGDLNTSVCISTPLYQDVYSSTLPIIGDPCDMSQTYKGVPSQLFRVVRATYSDSTFVITQNGNWTNIIHRPSGYLIAPYCSLNNVISLANVDYTKTAVVVPSGSLTKTSYWWYITPALSGIVYALPLLRRYVSAGIITQDQYNIFVIASQYNEQTQIRLVSDPQLVFIPNTDEFAALSDDEIFPYLVNCNSLFFGFNGVEYNVFPFQAYYDTSPSSPPNSSDPNYSTLIVQYKIKHESRRAKFQYFDYGMIPVMFNNDANFPVS